MWSQPSSVVLCMQNSDWLALELQVSMGTRSSPVDFVYAKQRDFSTRITMTLYGFQTLTCGFVHAKQRALGSRITSLCMVNPRPSPVVFACKTATSGPEHTSLYGSQTSPVIFCLQNSVPSFRMTSLYGSQPSSVVWCKQNSDFWTRLTCLYGS